MPQLFPPVTNVLAKATIFGAALIAAGLLWLIMQISASPYITEQDVVREQPVPFSHEHHVAGLGIDCRYCHPTVEESRFAGMPSTKTCMTCHSQIWTNAELLAPVRESWANGEPIRWNRVHDLPDFAQFNHAIHVAKGVGCTTCHGQIDQMPLTRQFATLQMGWCLDCHRAPEQFIRPREQVFSVQWRPPSNQLEVGKKLKELYGIKTESPATQAVDPHTGVGVLPTPNPLTNCSICHY